VGASDGVGIVLTVVEVRIWTRLGQKKKDERLVLQHRNQFDEQYGSSTAQKKARETSMRSAYVIKIWTVKYQQAFSLFF
jgi:hypothetical protein